MMKHWFKRFLRITQLTFNNDWFVMIKNPKFRDTIHGQAKGMRVWGVFHKFRYHKWSYDLTYDEALTEIDSLNQQLIDGKIDETELQNNYDEVVRRGKNLK